MHIRQFFFIACILLVSCNLPTAGGPTPDLVATEVSKILTDVPLDPITETPPIIIISATAPQLTETVVATITLPPSSSPTPGATQTPSFTPTAEITPVFTASLTPATLPEGTPTWKETFASGSSFGISNEGYDDGNTKISIADGELQLVSINVNSWRGWRLASHKPENYFLNADFRVGNCAGSDQYGLITQAPDYDSGYGYYFGITCDGRFSIQKWNENGLTNLDGWNETASIQAGSNQTNQIGIFKTGNKYQFYINTVWVAEVEDEFFKEPGFFGPYIAGLTTPNFTVYLQEISYWKNP